MDYRPALPKHNDNVSHEHPLREFFILIGWSAAIIVVVYWLLGMLVNTAVRYISPQAEQALYAAVGIDTAFSLDPDAATATADTETAQRLVDDLESCVQVGYPVTVTVIDNDTINAFATMGGRIVVMRGAMEATQSENGLAFVLAHELAHFKNRDHLRSTGRSVILLALSVMLTGTNSDLSKLVTPVTSLEGAQFSQGLESDADATALAALNCHYGHIGGATELFSVLAQENRPLQPSLSHYFASHPEAQQRIAALQSLAAKKGYPTLATQAR